ncbi:Methyltransferase domain-containing protein [Rhodovastum atsumiense]|uniref:Methyltransferase domain-containing protein n=1 Tax=Rhodovastum atsumiense TaxID=504468 RepID=A0A5M6INH6_9PROT|nr:class I SAM-dependent methyltransferase [Rhodovastum atsumiense]KAA5609537.1 methyltransferase domain-containing protein [Rhodovastum atsumiense]CAH2604934.1 Methyltransferase domain-containing protein [Rhodovastum atsumiense]
MSSWASGYVADIGYTHGFYRELTPALLGFISLARGRRSPLQAGPLTYCELGCGQGFSTNLLAAANPDIEFFATDFNPSHIAGAQAFAATAGTRNVHFFDQSFAEFVDEPSLPDCDIISLHGIYSWVTAEHRADIVRFIRRRLRPGGLVYISYNTQPGWSAAAPMRHLMSLHARTQAGPTVGRLDAVLGFTDRVLATNPGFLRANPAVRDRFDRIKAQNRAYLAHEYLNDAWTLFYHAEVAAELGEAKLDFIGSAALLEHIDAINLSPEQLRVLAEISEPTLRETVRDFMVNQQFRRDVFARGSVGLFAQEAREIWLEQRVALSTPRQDVQLTVTGSAGQATLQPETYLPVLDALAEGPRTLRQLLEDATIARLGWPRLQQAVLVLVGGGHLQPARDEAGEAARSERTTPFNEAVLQRARFADQLQFLASPVTGGGIMVDRIAQLFLLGTRSGQADPPGFAWDILSQQGQRLVQDGKSLESSEENLAALRFRFGMFTERQLPVLKQLGIA